MTSPVLSIAPLVVPSEGRAVPLQIRVSVPLTGDALPILLLSHGHGASNHLSSLNGYGPLASYFAARGFAVIQPTHLDSKTLAGDPRLAGSDEAPLFWRSRAQDMSRILDHVGTLELAARMDRTKVAVLGHSLGGHTASILLGARTNGASFADPRVTAGVLLAAPGAGDTLSDFARTNYGFFATTDFSTMTTPALVIAGDADPSPHLTTAGPAWHEDAYRRAPAPKTLVTLAGAEHLLGGVSGWDAKETSDEDPARVATVAGLAWAFLRSMLAPGDGAWAAARAALPGDVGRVEAK